MDISDWRKKIDALDLQIVELLNQRAQAAREIGKLKEATDMPVYEPNREEVIFENVRSHNRGPLPDSELVFIYQRLIAVMRCIQQNELASKLLDQP
jgi:chorismate mutase-like protein